MTYLDQKRAQAQKMYQEEQKYWAENAEEFKKYVTNLPTKSICGADTS